MIISGWGRNKSINCKIIYPQNINEIITIFKRNEIRGIITRGMGRSYGDISIYKNIISLEKFTKKFDFDVENGILNCSTNFTLEEILSKIVKAGWFFNVTPGSKYVSIGGAIANDVHGKNHHKDGSFCDFVDEIEIITPDGNIERCSKQTNSDLFKSTCGGAGMTGVILSAKIRLLKIFSKNLDIHTHQSNNIEKTLELFNKLSKNKYVVAWVDTLNSSSFGRSIIFSANHSNDKDLELRINKQIEIPSILVKPFMNKFFLSIFNKIYFFINKKKKILKQNIDNFFYPLEKIKNWNSFYGKNGFIQIQILILEKEKYLNVLNKIFSHLSNNNIFSYLTTLKEFGNGNDNFLSFPEKGLSLTLDIPNNDKLPEIYNDLEKLIFQDKIKIYLAKDSFMSKDFFKKNYKKINMFELQKNKIDPQKKMRSLLSERLEI